MKRVLALLAALVACGGLAAAVVALRPSPTKPPYQSPAVGVQTLFPARASGGTRLLTIEAATDVSFMRPFIEAFQRDHPQVAIQYVDMLSNDHLSRARTACGTVGAMPDLYLTISTDHLVELANAGCAAAVPKKIAAQAPAWARWRREVFAFSIEPAVFVYNKRRLAEANAPRNHQQLLETLRASPPAWRGRIGTYDIEQSGTGYNYASFDARQAAIYGRLIESFGRSQVKTYCCSDEMVDAVARGDILLAYNVQLSYAYAGQRAGRDVGVVLPSDYQAIQLRSVMVTRDARTPGDAFDFVQALLSKRGQALARAQIAPPPGAKTLGTMSSTERASQARVSASLLALRDTARRDAFIQEWRRAVRPPAPAEQALPQAAASASAAS